MNKTKSPIVLRLITHATKSKHAKIAQNNVKKVFIVSAGRTGTNFLADYFDSYSDVTAVHEPRPSWRLRLWAHASFLGKVSQTEMSAVLWSLRCKSLSHIKSHLYIESNPFLTGFIGSIDQVFEEANIIHIVRDPREYIKSSINHGNTVGIKMIMNKYVPFWYPNVGQFITPYENSIMMYRIAGYWAFSNNLLTKKGQDLPNYKLYKFEDIFDNSHSGLKKLSQHIGLPFKDNGLEKINRSKKSLKPSWKEWSDEEAYRVNSICSPLMEKYGYGNEPEWIQKIDRHHSTTKET